MFNDIFLITLYYFLNIDKLLPDNCTIRNAGLSRT